jgi:hypothetical protein
MVIAWAASSTVVAWAAHVKMLEKKQPEQQKAHLPGGLYFTCTLLDPQLMA